MGLARTLTLLLPPAVAALAILLAGCGLSSGSSSSSTVANNLFLSAVHNGAPDVGNYRSDVQLIRLGHVACDGFAAGASYEELADRIPDTEGPNPLPPADLGTVITSAVAAFCPQYRVDIS